MGKGILSDASDVFKQILSIGLFGLLFLIIFGNLSGNLGWSDRSVSIVNETDAWGHNATSYILDQVESKNASNVNAKSFVLTDVWGKAEPSAEPYDFQFINLGSNYSITTPGGALSNLTAINNTIQSNLSLSYSFLYNSENEIRTNQVIGNLTTGTVSFFSFMPTIFTLLAITVLILVVLAVIRKTNQGLEGGKSGPGFSS